MLEPDTERSRRRCLVNIAHYLDELKAQGIELSLHANGQDLSFRAKPGSLTTDIKAEIRAHKTQIVDHLIEAAGFDGIRRTTKTEKFCLSAPQNRLWLQAQFDGAPNNLTGAVRLTGALDVNRLQAALHALVQRHEVFRTRFTAGIDGLGYQDIEPDITFHLDHQNLRDHPDKTAHTLQAIKDAAAQPFDLGLGQLLQATLFELDSHEHVLLINMPHIVADGVSLEVFDRELGALYAGTELAANPIRYVDYAQWVADQTADQTEHQAAMSYWCEQLADAPVVTLPSDAGDQHSLLYQSSECHLPLLSRQQTDLIKQRGAQLGATPFMTLLAAFALTLGRMTAETDVTIATAINNRPKPVLQSMVGFFLNILALRIRLHEASSFEDLVTQTRRICLEAYQHQSLPFEDIVKALKPERVESRNPLARIAFAVGDTPWMPGHTLKLQGIDSKPIDIERGMLDFDMHLWVADTPDGLVGRLEYRTDLYTSETALALLTRFRTVIDQLLAQTPVQTSNQPPNQTQDTLRLADGLNDQERQWLLDKLACAEPQPQAPSHSVLDLWRQALAQWPNHIAVQHDQTTVTYQVLDERSDQIAHSLDQAGVHAGDMVALYLEPGISMVTAMLATLKRGAAYLPIDVASPVARVQFMLQDSQAKLVITTPGRAAHDELNAPVMVVDNDSQVSTDRDTSGQSISVALPTVNAGDLAYVTYTSGSTGKPKGVRVPHRAVVRLVSDTNYVDIGAHDRIGQLSNSAFDAFTFEIWGALLNGATVVTIARDTAIDPLELGNYLEQQEISVLFVTTALFNQLVSAKPSALANLRYLLFGGEQADVGAVRKLMSTARPQTVLHVYGPTENTTFSTFYRVTDLTPQTTTLPIGRPVRGTHAWVLSPDLALTLPGVTGELYLGGLGLADGYLNRPALDQEKFIAHPVTSARLYRTGDRVRVNADGELEFVGRIDNQIKLRGFRIELGEIEATLMDTSGVHAALVTTSGTGDHTRIVAYAATDLDEATLRQRLSARLPDYMVPAIIVCMAELPLNRNGKIDRVRLPAPAVSVTREIKPARNATEATLVDIWQEILEVQHISTDDNFFDVGGHSLLAARVMARISAQFGQSMPLRSLFEHPTIAQYAQWLENHLAAVVTAVEPTAQIQRVERGAPSRLSSAQERLWFLDRMNPDSPAYNISYALGVSGQLSVPTLQQVLDALLARHESLRTRFIDVQGEPRQDICQDAPLTLEEIDLRPLPADARDAALQKHRLAHALQPFQTDCAPLMRCALYRLSSDQWVLGFCLHHIIADGWSLAVLRRDLVKLYEAMAQDKPPALPDLPIQYIDYAGWDRAKRQHMDDELRFWRSELQELPALRLPTDYARPALPTFEGAAHRFVIDAQTTDRLTALANQHGATPFMVLLTAFAILLQRYSRQDDFAVGSPIAHRDHLDTEDLIGFFVNTLVLHCQLQSDASFLDHLAQTRATTLAAYANQDMPFERLVQELDPDRDPTTNPLVQVIFALQNAPISQEQMDGIKITPLEYLVATTRFDLEMHLWACDDVDDDVHGDMDGHINAGLNGILVYNTALFHPESMARLSRCFEQLLKSICAAPDQPIAELSAVTDADQQAALVGHFPVTTYPRDKTIIELFAEQVAQHPDKPALLLGNQTMTYGELDAQSARLAAHFVRLGMPAQAAVTIAIDASFAYVTFILAVLKAGGYYVPIASNEPASRLSDMLDTVKPWLAIDATNQATLLQTAQDKTAQAQDAGQPPAITPISLAYVMFTSGSTGTPKGVCTPHRAVVRLVKNTNFHAFSQDDVWLQAASLAFDASTLEIWGALLNGGSLAIVPPGQAAFADIGSTIRRHQVTSLWLTAGLFHSMVDTDLNALKSVRHLIAGGDVLSVKHVQKALHAVPGLTMTNGYGPTENTTFTCYHRMQGAVPDGLPIPIGRAVANTSVYIVDEHTRLVANGMPGELLTGGDGLALGYLDAPELTATRFIDNPLGLDDSRLYRTGDLVRRDINGDIQFLGRLDHQLKIRGFRVEAGEIEQALRKHASVENAAVTPSGEHEHKQLIAYVVPAMPAQAQTRQQLGLEQVKDWETLFDGSLYQNLQTAGDPTFNTAGWKSSYTGKAIPDAQMKDWLDDFISVVNRHTHDDVLEIGCGTGMVLFRVAPTSRQYVATDFSAQALAHVQHHLQHHLQHHAATLPVTLHHGEALDLERFTPKQFDTIILNSVVQYFPDIDYLRELIAKCLPLIRDGGQLIIGDIRSLPLLDAFHAGVTFANSDSHMRLAQWRSKVDRALLEEDELVISPTFFAALNLDRIARVSTRLQSAPHDNELSKFRYTAIIEVGQPIGQPTKQPGAAFDCPSLAVTAPDEVKQLIEHERPVAFRLCGLSNPRVAFELGLANTLNTTMNSTRSTGLDPTLTLAALKRQLDQSDTIGIDPHVWHQLGEQLGYQVDTGWSDDHRQGAYDVQFVRADVPNAPIGVALGAGCFVNDFASGSVSSRTVANQPMRGKLARALGPQLRAHCKQALPDYMVPAHFVMLPALPLTKSGKLDRRALFTPDSHTRKGAQQPSAAANDLERQIASIWGELLNIASPGVTENFFDLGGHSLLMVQVCKQLQDALGKKVPVLTMFQHPTIRALAKALGDTLDGGVGDGVVGQSTDSPRTTDTRAARAGADLVTTDAAAMRARKQRERVAQLAAQRRTKS